jgi:hypothetical protein
MLNRLVGNHGAVRYLGVGVETGTGTQAEQDRTPLTRLILGVGGTREALTVTARVRL